MSAGARYLFVSATSLFAADSGSSSANASVGVRWPSARMGLLSVSSTVSCGSRAMEGGRWACVWAGGGGSCRSCSRCRRAATSCTGRRNAWPCPVRRAARRAGRGRMPSRHHGYAAHARPVAHLNPDDLSFLFRQVRIHLAQGATSLRLAIRTISNLTGAALSIRQRGVLRFSGLR